MAWTTRARQMVNRVLRPLNLIYCPEVVLVHLHDVFLPFDYPAEWVVEKRWGWNEQYLVQAMLQGRRELETLWAGRYLQATRDDFNAWFSDGTATSLWLKVGGTS